MRSAMRLIPACKTSRIMVVLRYENEKGSRWED